MNSFTKRSRIFLLIILSLSFMVYSSNAQTSVNSSKVILIDDAHGQFINSSLLTGAIAFLRGEGFQVLPLTTQITQETLNGVDLLIIPNPSSTATFTGSEDYYMSSWLASNSNKGIIMLANPLNLNNSSLNGAGNVFNTLLESSSFTVSDQFQVGSDNNGVVVQKYQNISDLSYLQLSVNSTFFLPGNFSGTIATSSTALTLVKGESIVNSGYDSFTFTSTHTYQSQDVNLNLFGGITYKAGRIVLGGSTLMFSDLPNPNLANTTWFNSADNKGFFDALVKWSLNIVSQIVTPDVGSNFYITLGLITGSFGLTFVAVGLFLYATGKEMKIFEIDQNFLQSQSANSQDDKTGLTKSQKRLMQRKGK